MPGDYDGNGTTDIAVFRSGQWYVQGQPPFPQIWGTNCDIPQPLPYAIRTLIPHGGCADGRAPTPEPKGHDCADVDFRAAISLESPYVSKD